MSCIHVYISSSWFQSIYIWKISDTHKFDCFPNLHGKKNKSPKTWTPLTYSYLSYLCIRFYSRHQLHKTCRNVCKFLLSSWNLQKKHFQSWLSSVIFLPVRPMKQLESKQKHPCTIPRNWTNIFSKNDGLWKLYLLLEIFLFFKSIHLSWFSVRYSWAIDIREIWLNCRQSPGEAIKKCLKPPPIELTLGTSSVSALSYICIISSAMFVEGKKAQALRFLSPPLKHHLEKKSGWENHHCKSKFGSDDD